MKIQKKSISLIIASMSGLILYIWGSTYDYIWPNLVGIYVMALSIILLVWSRTNYLLFILFAIISYCNYSIVFAEYLSIIKGTVFTKYAGTGVANEAIYILLLFMSILTGILTFIKVPEKKALSALEIADTRYPEKITAPIVLCLDAVLAYIMIFSFGRPEQLGDRGTPTAVYEYSILLFILCLFYGKKNKLCRSLTMTLLIMFAMQNFLFGGRITGLQLIIVAYLMVYESRLSIKKALPFAIIGFFLLSIIGEARGAVLLGNFSAKAIYESLKNKKFTLDTVYSAYHTSMTFLMSEKNVGWDTRLSIMGGFLKTIIFGKYDSVESSVARYTAQYYYHCGGGILPFFFEFYLGRAGVALIAGYIAYLIKIIGRLNIASSGLTKCIGIYIVSSVFRWYIYSPIQITRGILLLIICYLLIEFVSRTVYRKRGGGINNQLMYDGKRGRD